MNDKLESIRQAVIKANPEIVELKFGCEVQYLGTPKRPCNPPCRMMLSNPIEEGGIQVAIDGWDESKNGNFDEGNNSGEFPDSHWPKKYCKVIGRPIRLADVLLASRNGSDGNYTTEGAITSRWNLRNDDLSQQSSECIEFLYQLLK